MSAASSGARSRKGLRRTLIAVVVVVVVAALVWAADAVTRSIAEKRVADAVLTAAPELTWSPDVTISGALFLPQLVSGRLDAVTLSEDDARYGDVSFSTRAVARGVPVEEKGTIDEVRVKVGTDAHGLNALLGSATDLGELSLGEGTVTYSRTSRIFGTDVSYDVTAEPEADGDDLLLKPKDVSVTSDLGALDLTPVVQAVLGDDPVRVCMARYLPEELRIEDVSVSPERVVVSGSAEDVARDGSSLTKTGSCS